MPHKFHLYLIINIIEKNNIDSIYYKNLERGSLKNYDVNALLSKLKFYLPCKKIIFLKKMNVKGCTITTILISEFVQVNQIMGEPKKISNLFIAAL